jgi:hypothetical protein
MKYLALLLIYIMPFISTLLGAFSFFFFSICISFFLILSVGKIPKVSMLWAVLFIPVFFGFLFGIKQPLYEVLKGAAYFLNPILYIYIGVCLRINFSEKFLLNWIVFSGFLLSITGLIVGFLSFGFEFFINPLLLREIYLWPVSFSILSVFLTLSIGRDKLGYSIFSRYTFLLLNVLGVYVSGSRTYLLLFVVYIVIIFYYENRVRFIFFFIVISCCLYALSFNDFDNDLINKLGKSRSELELKDFRTEESINTNYRGYESVRALISFEDGHLGNYIAGHGLGKLVDLGIDVKLGSEFRRFIPVLHNGYLYILVKTGFLGIGVYILFFFRIFGRLSQLDWSLKPIVLAATISLCISNIVVSSFFTKEFFIVWILIGYYLGNKEKVVQTELG